MWREADAAPERRGTDSEKWGRFPPDVIPLWVADMDFPSPEPVRRALAERVAHGVFGYARDPGDLRALIVERMVSRYGWGIRPSSIIFLPGVAPGFHLACRAAGAPGGRVLVQTPVYPPLLSAQAGAGRTGDRMELRRGDDGAYGFDPGAFDAAFAADTRMFLLCNPHNPVGRAFRRAELATMAESCLRHGAILCADEIHCDLVYPGHAHIPVASLDPEIARRTITLMAPSKTFNLPGLKVAFAIIPDPELRRRFREAGPGVVNDVNVMGLAAATAAYRDGGGWLEEALAYLASQRDRVVATVRDRLPGLAVQAPEATYLAWIDARGLGLPDPCAFFLREARVALGDGRAFGPGGDGFVRLNFACTRTVLDEALERMAAAVSRLA